MNIDGVIKKVSARNEKGKILLEIKLHENVKLPPHRILKEGEKYLRLRHTVADVKYTPRRLEYYKNENNSKPIAFKFYKSLFPELEMKEVILFEDIAFLALEQAEAEAGRKNDRDTKMYLSILENHILNFFGKKPLVDLYAKDAKTWFVEQGKLNISQSTFNKRYYVLKKVISYAVDEKIISNILENVKRSSKLFRKRKTNDDAYYTQEQVDLMLNDKCESCTESEMAKNKFLQAYIVISVGLGLRSGEVSAAKFSDISWDDETITVQRSITKGLIGSTKTGKSRTLPLTKELKERLLKYQESAICDWMFPNPLTLKPYTDSRTISDHKYKPMLKRLNIPYLTIYRLRHTFTTLAMLKGAKLTTISKCLGHSGTEVTQRHYLCLGNTNQDDMRTELENLTA